MRFTLLLALLSVLLVACSSVDVSDTSAVEPVESVVREINSEPVVAPDSVEKPVIESDSVPESLVESVPDSSEQDIAETDVVPVSIEPVVNKIFYEDSDPSSELGCEQLLSVGEVSSACNINSTINTKIGTNNCLVNVKDNNNPRLTMGVTLTGFDSVEKASSEFVRRMDVAFVNSVDVGDKAYSAVKGSRNEVNFVRGKYIVNVGADSVLCSVDGLVSLAKIVDDRVKTK